MKKKLSKLVPVGMDGKQEVIWLLAAGCLAFMYSLGFLWKFFQCYNDLFEIVDEVRVLKNDGTMMLPFLDILGGRMMGFAAAALCMVPLAIYHYAYHYSGAKSIYVMRRIPDKFELHRRCLALPILGALAYAVMAALLILIYLGIYVAVTPEKCMLPGQW